MNLFKKPPNTKALTALTPALAKIIYDLLATNIDATTVFTKHGHNIKHTEQVIAEMSRMESLAIQTIRDNQSMTKGNLVASISSTLLIVATVVDDIIKYNPSFQDNRSFADFKTEMANTE